MYGGIQMNINLLHLPFSNTYDRQDHRPLEWDKGGIVTLYKIEDPAIPSNHCLSAFHWREEI